MCLQEINRLQGRKSDFQDLEKEREEINKKMQVILTLIVYNPFLVLPESRFIVTESLYALSIGTGGEEL